MKLLCTQLIASCKWPMAAGANLACTNLIKKNYECSTKAIL
jgi:hypothetical protein